MKKLLTIFAFAAIVSAQEKAPTAKIVPPKEAIKEATPIMTEVQSRDVMILQLQDAVLSLREQLADRDKQIVDLTKQLQKTAREATIKGICEDKKVPVAQCSIDPSSGQVTAKSLPINPAQQ